MSDFLSEIHSDESAECDAWEAERMEYLDAIGYGDDDETEVADEGNGDDVEMLDWFQEWDGV